VLSETGFPSDIVSNSMRHTASRDCSTVRVPLKIRKLKQLGLPFTITRKSEIITV
jgi:hypothetical protein